MKNMKILEIHLRNIEIMTILETYWRTSTIMKKIIHKTRSQNKIVLGCAATALAAQVYDSFDTFHGLFKYPVVKEMEDIDQIDCVELNMTNFPQRKELIEKAKVII